MAARRKRINLPAIARQDIDLEHILDAHTEGGSRVGSSKTLYPAGWTGRQVETAVLEAYSIAKRVLTQGVRVKVKGSSGGLTLEMWVNLESRRIETAYPV
jgi:hypothetical protein